MIERLIRIALALAVAFVFTGRMEAAAAHCVRLAQEGFTPAAESRAQAAESQNDGTMSCHNGGQEIAQKAQTPAKAKHHGKAGERCDCVGVLNAFAEVGGAARSAHIEPYEWARPDAAAFASIEPAPALRPPRA
jgi:hypothetical protein